MTLLAELERAGVGVRLVGRSVGLTGATAEQKARVRLDRDGFWFDVLQSRLSAILAELDVLRAAHGDLGHSFRADLDRLAVIVRDVMGAGDPHHTRERHQREVSALLERILAAVRSPHLEGRALADCTLSLFEGAYTPVSGGGGG